MSGVLFAYTTERQMKKLRAQVLRHLLYLNIRWYDKLESPQLSSRLTVDPIKAKDGWNITLVMTCSMSCMVISMGAMLKIMQKRAVHVQQMYAEAGAVAEETLGSIRTVSSLNAEKRAFHWSTCWLSMS
ncbi:hypothetical protein PF008_g10150 [Phytophthora fragariae]|uniref:ABC transmembrane type-1 domain-containing protein n=1 Tax=Phytophthora fragariae TaxID=53985 RepID=A0A6G0RV45_9STRA|nr:hypothetical protein PF008_g10150 [Phytophthora fragariae]